MICDKCEKRNFCEDPCKEAIGWVDLGEEYRIPDIIKRIGPAPRLQSLKESKAELKRKRKGLQ